MDVRQKLDEYAEMQGWNKNKLIGWSEAAEFAEAYHQSKLAEMPSDEEIEKAAKEFEEAEYYRHSDGTAKAFESGVDWLKQHLTESKQEEGEVISDKEIETYVKGKYGKSALKPEIIARRAIQDYRNGLPPFSKNKAVLDKPEGEEKKRTI
jgi:hypothetical protein